MVRSEIPSKKLWKKASMDAKEMGAVVAATEAIGFSGLPHIMKNQDSKPHTNEGKKLQFAFPPVSAKTAVIFLDRGILYLK